MEEQKTVNQGEEKKIKENRKKEFPEALRLFLTTLLSGIIHFGLFMLSLMVSFIYWANGNVSIYVYYSLFAVFTVSLIITGAIACRSFTNRLKSFFIIISPLSILIIYSIYFVKNF